MALDDNQIVLADLLPNRSPQQQKAIEQGIKTFENKNKMVVGFQSTLTTQPPSAFQPTFPWKPQTDLATF